MQRKLGLWSVFGRGFSSNRLSTVPTLLAQAPTKLANSVELIRPRALAYETATRGGRNAAMRPFRTVPDKPEQPKSNSAEDFSADYN